MLHSPKLPIPELKFSKDKFFVIIYIYISSFHIPERYLAHQDEKDDRFYSKHLVV